MKKITETASLYTDLEKMSVQDLLFNMNREDHKVATAIEAIIPQIEILLKSLIPCFQSGGRLFYIGAGTSGRLGILDASEIPPTYGYPHDRVIGLIAGGDSAIRKSVEFAEDNTEQAWLDLLQYNITSNDFVIGIAASGTTPYAIGGINKSRSEGLLTGCITNNPGSPLSIACEFPIEINVGPEFVTGSTRMKSGTSQKLVLNMISTALMIKMERVKGNKMINMQLSNNKLIDRGIRFIMDELNISSNEATILLEKHNSVDLAIKHYNS